MTTKAKCIFETKQVRLLGKRQIIEEPLLIYKVKSIVRNDKQLCEKCGKGLYMELSKLIRFFLSKVLY